jgi:class 3 adenylate cyclase/tetratricopeptide (TPR) repeat protein
MDDERAVERRIVTVLFADLVGFTSLSERLDPEDVASVQDAYFATVREVIGRYGGTLEKFIGDAAMAVFGAPVARDDDAERAVRAGLALTGAIEQVAAQVGLEESDLRLRVGVNTGEVVHAEAGPDAGRVTGDTVNTTARFQTAAAPGQVLVGETTALSVADAIELEDTGRLDLKGKAEPVRAWAAVGVLPSRSRDQAMGGLRAPMLGRDRELAWLQEGFRRAGAGRSERRLVVAPPGVGKSRLLSEFGSACEAAGAPVWRVRLRPDVVSPFEPVAQLLAAALAGAGLTTGAASSEEAGELVRSRMAEAGATPARATVVAEETLAVIRPTTGEQAAADREARFASWLEALDALAGRVSAVWLFEDVHWAGGDLLAFLDGASGPDGESARLVVCTSRPSLLERHPAWCAQNEDAGRFLLDLPPLSPVGATDLVTHLVGEALPASLVEAIAERSDGNPLFIEELLRTWISVGTLAPAGGTWRLTADAAEVPLPPTVQAIYAAQIDDLPSGARRVARRASVAGRRFPIAALAPLGIEDGRAAIEPLRTRALVTGPLSDPTAGPSYAYRHALLRDAGYATLARAERARLHARLARWLEGAAGDRAADLAEQIARHYAAAVESAPALAREVDQGLNKDEAVRLAASWFERAGQAALGVAAHDAARTLFRRALDLTPEPSRLDRARRWERLGDATAFAADMDEGGRALRQAVDLYRDEMTDAAISVEARATARTGYARALSSLGMVWNQQLRFEDASALADEGLRTIGEAPDLETARLLYLRAWSAFMFAIPPGIREDLERVLSLARQHGDSALELEATHQLYHLLVEEGRVGLEEMLQHDREVIHLARDLGNWQRVVHTTWMQGLNQSEERAEEAWPLFDDATEIAEAHGLSEELAWIDYARAEAGLVAGNWGRAWEASRRGIDLAERHAYHRAEVRTWFVLTPMALARARHDVLEHADRWFAEHQSIFPPSPYGKFMHGAVDLRLTASGLRSRTGPVLDDVIAVWDETQGWGAVWDAAETIADAWLHRGELDWVRAWLDAMARWHDHPLTTDLGRGSHGLIAARLHLAEGRSEEARTTARGALDAFRRCRAPWWVWKAIRVLEAADAAAPLERKEARRIEAQLGIVAG